MPLFKYKAIDSYGNNQKGSIEAANKQNATQILQEKNYFILEIGLAKQGSFFLTQIFKKLDLFQPKISKKQIVDFTRQFSSLLKTGIPYHRSLQIIINSEKNKLFRDILNKIYTEVLEGVSLASCLKKFPNTFSTMYISLVEAGETGGNLGELMQKQSEFDHNQLKIENRIRNAMLYPIIMCFVALGIIIFMVKFILPKIIPIFDHFDAVLPLPTRVVIFLSDAINNYGWSIFIIFIVILFLIKFWLQTKNGKLQLDTFILKIPFYNDFLKKILNYRFIQVLATLLSSGVTLTDALEICEKVTGNSCYEQSIQSLEKEVTQRGFSLSQALQKLQFLNEALMQTIQVGEESGNLPTTLKQSAKNLEIELETALSKYVSLLEPSIILIMALFVGFIILSVLLPMFQLNQLV